MTKYRLLFWSAAVLCINTISVWAQRDQRNDERSLFEKVQNIKERQDRFQLYLDTHMSADAEWQDREMKPFRFRGRELRLDARGKINDRFSYRLMQRFNVPQDASQAIDNLPASLDVAGLGVKLSDQWSLFLGKQCAAYGGIQFDYNPIVVYEYADIFSHLPIFLTGIKVSYEPIEKQQFQLQILNSYNEAPLPNPSPSNGASYIATIPLNYTLNWNGTIAPGLSTRWSYSFINQSRIHHTQFVSLGNQYKSGAFGAYFDAMFAKIDVKESGNEPRMSQMFRSYVLKCNYFATPQWNVFAKGIYEVQEIDEPKHNNGSQKGWDNYAVVAGLEYYPMEKSDLHFYMTFTERHRNRGLGIEPYSRLSMGFIYQIPMF